jgi:hypothetical protein
VAFLQWDIKEGWFIELGMVAEAFAFALAHVMDAAVALDEGVAVFHTTNLIGIRIPSLRGVDC